MCNFTYNFIISIHVVVIFSAVVDIDVAFIFIVAASLVVVVIVAVVDG